MAEAQPAPQEKAPPQQQQQEPEKQSKQEAEQAAGKTFTQAEWAAREEEFDRKARKIRRNAEREAESRWQREQGARQQPEKKDPPADPDPEPQREAFEDHETYLVAKAEWAGRKGHRDESAKQEKDRTEKSKREAQEKAERSWHSRIERAMDKHADFERVLEDNSETMEEVYRAPMSRAITESDVGPEIVRHLLLNKDEVKRIAALPGYKQAAEIVKIEEQLAAAGQPAQKGGAEEEGKDDDAEDAEEQDTPEPKRDAASGQFRKDPPPPIEPGSGRSATNSTLPSDKDDSETWRRKEIARMRKREGK